MAWLIHVRFIFFIQKNSNYLKSNPSNLSASIDVSMHFQRHILKCSLNSKSPLFEICLHSINFNFTSYFMISTTLTWNSRTSKAIPLDKANWYYLQHSITFLNQWLLISSYSNLHFFKTSSLPSSLILVLQVFTFLLKMASNISYDSNDSDVFYVDLCSNYGATRAHNATIPRIS